MHSKVVQTQISQKLCDISCCTEIKKNIMLRWQMDFMVEVDNFRNDYVKSLFWKKISNRTRFLLKLIMWGILPVGIWIPLHLGITTFWNACFQYLSFGSCCWRKDVDDLDRQTEDWKLWSQGVYNTLWNSTLVLTMRKARERKTK